MITNAVELSYVASGFDCDLICTNNGKYYYSVEWSLYIKRFIMHP